MSTWRPWVVRGWTAEGVPSGVDVVRGDAARTVASPLRRATPADVRTLHEGAVYARVPAPGGSLPVNRLPFVAFTEDDLPWRLSPMGRRQPAGPWLALVVLPEAEAPLEVDPDGLRHVTLDASVLPDDVAVARCAHAVDDGPSRVLCTMPLAVDTACRALVVPALDANGALAWAGGGEVRLRVLLEWRFRTVAARDFAGDVAQLTPAGLAELGWRPVGVDAERDVWVPGAVVRGEGPEAADLSDVEEGLRDAVWPRKDGVLQPPVRGPDVRGPVSEPLPEWFEELNFHPASRIVAAAGEALVRSRQEALIARVLSGRAPRQLRRGIRVTRPVLAEPELPPRLVRHATVPAVRKQLDRVRVGLGAISALAEEEGAIPLRRRPGFRVAMAAARRKPAVRALDTSVFEEGLAHAPEVMLPGLSRLALEEYAWLSPHPAFASAFWTGVNEELLRELRWRELPVPDGAPMPGFWPGEAFDPAGEGPGTGFLVLRSAIWSAFPDVWVGLFPRGGDGDPDPDGAWVVPERTLRIAGDTRLIQWPVGRATAEACFLVFAQDADAVSFRRLDEAEGDAVAFAAAALERPLEVWLG